jgi:hypothetical protein
MGVVYGKRRVEGGKGMFLPRRGETSRERQVLLCRAKKLTGMYLYARNRC